MFTVNPDFALIITGCESGAEGKELDVTKRSSERLQRAHDRAAIPTAGLQRGVPVPDNWQSRIRELLRSPSLGTRDGAELADALGWRTMPAGYWQRVQDITERVASKKSG